MNLNNISAYDLELMDLPDAALLALRDGKEWEYEPESIDGADADAYYCDDCDTWHMMWTVWGLRLDAAGNLYETEWSVDTDGDWAFHDEYPCEEYDHTQARERVRESWREYARWVVRKGRDPLGEFVGYAGVRKTKTTYTAQFVGTVAGSPRVLRVRRGKEKYAPLSEFPDDVRQFLETDEQGFLREFSSLDDLKQRSMNVTWWGNRGTFTIERTTGVNNAAEARKKAREFLANNKEAK